MSYSEDFRRSLLKIISKTIPSVALAGVAVAPGCGILISGDIECHRDLPTCNSGPASGSKSEKGKISWSWEKPLTYEECKRICEEKMKSACGAPGTGYFFVVAGTSACKETVDDKQNKMYQCDYAIRKKACPVAGRRPAGLQSEESLGQSDQTVAKNITEEALQEVGSFLAELAYLEEAAVTAFEYLTKELEYHNAPEELIALSKRAIEEEVEHANLMKMLAQSYGFAPVEVKVEPFKIRTLAEMAYDNVKEGCIRETYGALMAFWQSKTAQDEAVQAVMGRIAWEESEHAALSWAIDEWIRPQLTEQEQQTCAKLFEESMKGLEKELQFEPSQIMVQHVGYPTLEAANALYNEAKSQWLS